MLTAVVLCLIVSVSTAVAWFRMGQNISAMQAALAEREAEQRRVQARRRALEEQLRGVLSRGRALTQELSSLRQQVADAKAQIQRVRDITRTRIDDELMSRD